VSISEELRSRIGVQADHRCGYCQSSQRYVFAPLEVDHILPRAYGGADDEDNLWLACLICNGFKSARMDAVDPLTGESVRLFNPRRQNWIDHFAWSTSGVQIVGLTPTGRATVMALNLNNVIAAMVRHEWVSAGWHPPVKD